MAIADDFSVSTAGDIRYTGTGTNYTVLAFHRFLQDLADDAEAAGDDLVDITTDTPSDRSTDQIITLNSPFNIDDTAARHLYDGSITQAGGDTVYSGLNVLGTVEAATEVMIIQDDNVLPAYWGTGINADGAIFTRMLIKSRESGADIDGQRILVLAREMHDQFREFSVTLGLANSVAAISTSADLNAPISTGPRTTLEGYDVTLTEGFQEIDIDANLTVEDYYAQFDKGSQTLNDTYEVSKWWSARALVTDSGTDTGTSFAVDNGTIKAQGHEFTARGQEERLCEARFRVLKTGSPNGNLYAELYLSDDAADPAPTGGVLATSDPVLGSQITTTATETIFRFNDFANADYQGTPSREDQRTGLILTAGENYIIVLRSTATGDGSNFFQVDGDTTGITDDGERSENTGAWAGVNDSALWFIVKSAPTLYSRPGEKHRGITHSMGYDGQSGAEMAEGAYCFWGTRITYDGDSGIFERGRYVTIAADGAPGVIVNAGKILFDDTTGNVLYLALEDISGTIADNDIITQIGGTAASAIATATFFDDTVRGGIGALHANDTVDDNLYIQLISGVAPVDNLRISTAAADFVVVANELGTITSRTISPEFIGQSTGSNLIGAYGIGFDTNDVGSSDLFFDLTNTQRQPPNNVTFTVTGLVALEDRILVGPRTAGDFAKGQWQLDGELTSAGVTSIVVTAGTEASPIASDTPTNGQDPNNSRLRVLLDNGVYKRQEYVSYSGVTFTVPSTDYSTLQAANGNDVFLAYIDILASGTSESYTAVYDTDRDLIVRVRDGASTPIKTFQGNATFGSTSSSVAAIRTTDA